MKKRYVFYIFEWFFFTRHRRGFFSCIVSYMTPCITGCSMNRVVRIAPQDTPASGDCSQWLENRLKRGKTWQGFGTRGQPGDSCPSTIPVLPACILPSLFITIPIAMTGCNCFFHAKQAFRKRLYYSRLAIASSKMILFFPGRFLQISNTNFAVEDKQYWRNEEKKEWNIKKIFVRTSRTNFSKY